MNDGSLWGSSAFMCYCTILTGYGVSRALNRTCKYRSVATMITRSHTIDFFPIGPSQGFGVSRRCEYTNGFSCTSVCCLYFCEQRAASSSIPRRAQACLDCLAESLNIYLVRTRPTKFLVARG
ncbi:hypothetical protein TNCV_3142791 [Trichonephila clavipes]|nr:hypothetical protein TNCV_3142791 [Trichonephila clavipes]